VTDRPLDLDVVRAAVGDALGRAARPADVVVVERLPMLATGKPDRRAIRAIANPTA
jgi:O-succinylbenzoic acid--CoA ligase